MHSSTQLLTLVAAASSAAATYQGFNYDAQVGGKPKTQEIFASEFSKAANLPGTNGGYTSARLFTMIQGGTANEPISAIPAALASDKTSLLFGLWCSAGDAQFANEIKALQNTAELYCNKGLKERVAGISVGSEDLYRNSEMGKKKSTTPGASADTIIKYIKQVRETVKGTCLSDVPIGHVDTWNAYEDGANRPVIDAIDWIGADEYPYFENEKANSIDKGSDLFDAAIEVIKNVGKGKPIWITESGFPVSGKQSGQATPSIKNAERYYKDVACRILGNMNVWWYTLHDGEPNSGSDPIFSVADGQGKPLYDLSCSTTKKSTSDKSSGSSKVKGPVDVATSTPDSDSDPATGSASGSASNPGSGSGAGSSAGSGAGSGAGSNGSVVTPSTGGRGNNTVTGGAQPTGGVKPGSGGGSGGAVNPPQGPVAGGSQLNSLGAAAVALVLAVAVL